MISRNRALELLRAKLDDPRRMEHSLAVAERMAGLAKIFRVDTEKWYLTGLLHDIDLPLTLNDMSRHGLVAARSMLKGLLPPRALTAIEAHDPRTGVVSETRIAQALRFADVLENILPRVGVEALREAAATGLWKKLEEEYPDAAERLRTIRNFLKNRPSPRI